MKRVSGNLYQNISWTMENQTTMTVKYIGDVVWDEDTRVHMTTPKKTVSFSSWLLISDECLVTMEKFVILFVAI